VTIPVTISSLGCARNDVDSEELAARLEAAGFTLVETPAEAAVVLVNTCGFIEAAKAESIAEILDAVGDTPDGTPRRVIATGCLATRYGSELAASLPEADAVVGFDRYDDIADVVRQVLAGKSVPAPPPVDRRTLLPVAPAARAIDPARLGAWLPSARRRLSGAPSSPLKIASGCDRRCAFCAIPGFRGAFSSRTRADLTREAAWLATQGVTELYLVSENTTSYGKDFGDPHALETLLRDLSAVDGIEWLRLSYLQPAEVKPSLIEAIATTDKVVPYFDLPFQHASATVLRRMRRFGDADSFLELLATVRAAVPAAGIRSNVIVGFPGETAADVDTLRDFLGEAGLDAVGVFPYSDEEGTEAYGLDGHLDEAEIAARTDDIARFADTVTAWRAAERIGETVTVLVEGTEDGFATGRAAQQGPDDGRSRLVDTPARDHPPGTLVSGVVTGTDGVDWLVGPASDAAARM